ncbi:MAG: uroporphyrinogen decarboxylase [Pseudomonadota bacterium]
MAQKKMLQVLRGEALDTPPIWLMRQAGRYMAEYRAVRAKAGDFLTLCYTPDYATEVTLQPIRSFGFDASILFSDILVVPDGLGRKLWFETGEGPRLEPIQHESEIAALDIGAMQNKLAPVYETVSRLRAQLPEDVTLIGFCGAPWTVATYMIEGGGSKDHVMTRAFAYQNPKAFAHLIDVLVDASVEHLAAQIAAGAEVVQVFDSWSGALTSEGFRQWCIEPMAQIATRLRARAPHIPIIGFPKGAGTGLTDYAAGALVDAIGLDTAADLHWVTRNLPANMPVQGNLDPALLMSDSDTLLKAVHNIRSALRGRPYIFNLGHGIPQTADIDLVHLLVDAVRMPFSKLTAKAA